MQNNFPPLNSKFSDKKTKTTIDIINLPVINLGNISENEMMDFVKVETNYYFNGWKLGQERKTQISWNWAAFLFPVFWLAYRKMYLLAGIAFCLGFLLSFITEITHSYISLISELLFFIIFGLWGNAMYLKHAKRMVNAIRVKIQDEKEKSEIICRQGGTSLISLIILILITVITIVTMGIVKWTL
ncbi:DUF2628 domain-containing protein [bacterium]|nr:DUF2628 domain-containing protein [bacterium]